MWGTSDSPEITYLTGGEVELTGTVWGAGVLILDTAFEADHGGSLNFEGLILTLPSAKLGDHDQETDNEGTANIFGSFISIPPGPAGSSSLNSRGTHPSSTARWPWITLATPR